MKLTLALVLIFLLIAVALTVRSRRDSGVGESRGAQDSNTQTYLGLRNLALQAPPPKLIVQESTSTAPYAVLMDWGIPSGTATVAAYADGTASVYLSSGGGFLGGGQSHESINKAARRMVEIAGEVQSLMQPTTTYPLPERRKVAFYVRTSAGIYTATASDDDLQSHRSPFSKLGDAAQAIITEYRLIQETK